jgi:hypothetical protein
MPDDPGPYVFDGTAWRREAPEPGAVLPPARTHHAMAYDAARDRIVLFGGTVDGANAGDTWERDGATGRWTRLGPKDG